MVSHRPLAGGAAGADSDSGTPRHHHHGGSKHSPSPKHTHGGPNTTTWELHGAGGGHAQGGGKRSSTTGSSTFTSHSHSSSGDRQLQQHELSEHLFPRAHSHPLPALHPAARALCSICEDSDLALMSVAAVAAIILCLLVTHLRTLVPATPPPALQQVHVAASGTPKPAPVQGGQASSTSTAASGDGGGQQGAAAPGSADTTAAAARSEPWRPLRQPLVIAHRGLSGLWPEHTREAYQGAIDAGADVIECDVVLTRDLVPICRHDPELSGSTDVLSKFAQLKRSYDIDGERVTGVFAADLTMEQIRQLRAVQPWPFRDQQYNGKLPLVTLDEYLDVALAASAPARSPSTAQQQQQSDSAQSARPAAARGQRRSRHRAVAVYVETKSPTWHNALPHVRQANTSIEALVLAALERRGFQGPINSDRWRARPAFLQSFETGSLRALSQHTCLPLIQLVGGNMSEVLPEGRTTEQVLSGASLRELAAFGVVGVGPGKQLLVRWEEPPPSQEGDKQGRRRELQQEQKQQQQQQQQATRGRLISSGVVERLHQEGFQVHPYTLRNEAQFVLPGLDGNATREQELLLLQLGVDGAFTDFSGTVVGVLDRARQAGFTWDMSVANRPATRPCPQSPGATTPATAQARAGRMVLASAAAQARAGRRMLASGARARALRGGAAGAGLRNPAGAVGSLMPS